MTVDAILKAMTGAAAKAFGDEWKEVKNVVPAELHKFAVQLAAIPENVAKHEIDKSEGYSVDTGKIIVRMQFRALEATLTAVTAVTLVAVQRAMNAIVDVLKKAFVDLAPLFAV
jgi:hypothetical protein